MENSMKNQKILKKTVFIYTEQTVAAKLILLLQAVKLAVTRIYL